MKDDTLEILSTFADGESVETPRLLGALMEPGAYQALVDFIRLRGVWEETEGEPRSDFLDGLQAELDPSTRSWWRRPALASAPVLAPALAAVLALFFATFLLLKTLGPTEEDAEPADLPPATERVLYFEEGVDWKAPSA